MKSNGSLKRYLQLNNKYINDADECLKKGVKIIKQFVTRMRNRFDLNGL